MKVQKMIPRRKSDRRHKHDNNTKTASKKTQVTSQEVGPFSPPNAYSAKQLSKYSSLSRSLIYKAKKNGDLISFKHGGKTLFKREDIFEWLLRNRYPRLKYLDKPTMVYIAFSIQALSERYNMFRSTLYELIKREDISITKMGSRTIIICLDATAYERKLQNGEEA